MVTPGSIVPELYLLPFYAILRSIPNKLLGVLAMFGSLLILLVLPLTDLSRIRSNQFRPAMKLAFLFLIYNTYNRYYRKYFNGFSYKKKHTQVNSINIFLFQLIKFK